MTKIKWISDWKHHYVVGIEGQNRLSPNTIPIKIPTYRLRGIMQASYKIRPTEPEDLSQIVELWQSVGLPGSAHGAEKMQEILTQGPALILVIAEQEGKVIGTILGGTDGWWGWLYRLAVASEYQRQGIGEALVREAEKRLRDRGVRYVNTIVHGKNVSALRVLEKAGWSLDEECVRLSKRI